MLQLVLRWKDVPDIACEAAEYLEHMLVDPDVSSHLLNYCWALPWGFDVEIDHARLALSAPSVAQLIEDLLAGQPAISMVRRAWQNVVSLRFASDTDRASFELTAVTEGVFRALALAALGRHSRSTASFSAHAAMRRAPNHREILAAWLENIDFPAQQRSTPANVTYDVSQLDDEDSTNGFADEADGPTFAHVNRQKREIVARLQRGDTPSAKRFTDELVAAQLRQGHNDLAAKTLCSLAQEAKRYRYTSLQLEWVERATDVAPTDHWAFAQAADAYLSLYRFYEADQGFRKAIELGDPQYGLLGQARIFRLSSRFDDALTRLRAAMDIGVNDRLTPSIYYEMGLVQFSMGASSSAVKTLDRALELYPYDGMLHCARADVLRGMGSLDEAMSAYESATQHYPDLPAAYDGLARTLRETGRFSEAIDIYDRAIFRFPDEASLHYGRSSTRREMGEFSIALDGFIEIKRLFPDSPLGYSGEAWTLREMGRYSDAQSAYDLAIERFDFDPSLRNGRAFVLKQIGRLDEALAAYNQNHRDFPYNLPAMTARARLLRELGHTEDALKAFDAILSLRPYYRRAQYAKASVYAMRGEFASALDLLPANEPKSRSDWIAHHIRGVILLKQRAYEAAIAHFRHGLLNNPHFSERRYYESAIKVASIAIGDYSNETVVNAALDPVQDTVAQVIDFHAAAALGRERQAAESFEILRRDPHPNVVSLTEEIARRFGLLSGEPPRHSADWILDQEADVVLAFAA